MSISFFMVNLLKMAALSRPHRVTQLRDFNNFSSWRGQDATQRIWSRSDKNPGRSSLNSNACARPCIGGAVEAFWISSVQICLSRDTVRVYQISCSSDKPVILYELLKISRGRCGSVWPRPFLNCISDVSFRYLWQVWKVWWYYVDPFTYKTCFVRRGEFAQNGRPVMPAPCDTAMRFL